MSEPVDNTPNAPTPGSHAEDLGRGLTGLSSAWPLRVESDGVTSRPDPNQRTDQTD